MTPLLDIWFSPHGFMLFVQHVSGSLWHLLFTIPPTF